ncbi:beta strand repeat-containing protein, partial [Azohydromonas lata]
VAPTVTDARIAISGGSGAGGAYKIGDTVTATWTNVGGDANADISGVTFDFSAFGGGTDVAAVNVNGVWTATYTLVAGSIDATGRNVSATVTDDAGNVTTTADTSNATVDSMAPTVTDAHIAISGATGTGGTYRIGDTVTATWTNTVLGDANADTISGVTFDFSAFGGGTAVAASNVNGVWTATYTLVAGSIDATDGNVSVTVTDDAGNTTTAADTSDATVDNVAPTVTDTNVAISGASSLDGTYRIGDTVTANWSNAFVGDDNADAIAGVTFDFSAFGGGTAVAATNDMGLWTATYVIVSGNIQAVGRNVAVTVTDDAGNTTTRADTTNAVVDNVAPTVTDAHIAISGGTGTGGAFKIGDTVTASWDNTAAGDHNADTISGVTFDFSAFGGGSAVVAVNDNGVWTASFTLVDEWTDATGYNVTVTATDGVGNTTTTADTTNAVVDTVAPTVSFDDLAISGATGPYGAYRIGDTVTATWTDTGGDANTDTLGGVTFDFSAFGGGTAVAATNKAGVWTATYTLVAGNIDSFDFGAAVTVTVTDDAGNTTTMTRDVGAMVDNVAPTVTDANVHIRNIGSLGSDRLYKVGDTVEATWAAWEQGDENSDALGPVTFDFSAFGGGSAVEAVLEGSVWTARYTLVAGSIDATGRNVTVTVMDDAGNTVTVGDTSGATVDNIVPAVTDANVSIRGATGLGGAFKIGDTVTATWNNTAAGDHNADIGGVTFDFSAFGGGTAVAATNVNGVWTAAFTIVDNGGRIDATHCNVTVTVTDDGGNATTVADTANAVVDNDAPWPVVFSLSGATGTHGAYRIGDTITATWVDTNGDHDGSDAVTRVTFDFSAFGGGAAVAATKLGGVWTASCTIVADDVDATDCDVSITMTDDAGNTTTHPAYVSNVLDNVAPTVTDANVNIRGATGAGGAFKTGDTVTATWNNTAAGDHNADVSGVTFDFSAFGGGTAVAATNVNGVWTASCTIVAGGIVATGRNVSVTVTDDAGNTTTRADTAGATVDSVAPTLSISSTVASLKAGETATITFTFSEDPGASFTLDDVVAEGGTLGALSGTGLTRTVTFTPTAGTADGMAVISVAAGRYSDAAGNAGSAAGLATLRFDTLAPATPSLASTSPTSDGTPVLHGTAEAGSMVDVTVGGATFRVMAGSDGLWTLDTADVRLITAGRFNLGADGVQGVTLRSTDAAGNRSEGSGQFSLDTAASAAPTVVLSEDSGASATDWRTSTHNPLSLCGTAGMGDTVTVDWGDGGAAEIAQRDGSGWHVGQRPLAEGTYTVTVTSTDAAGNTSRTVRTLVVDNTGPAVAAGDIRMAGATGTNGAFRIGDTVVATWNGPAGGDGSRDAAFDVRMDFSLFGGPEDVQAKLVDGVWTASWTIVAGDIDRSQAHVVVKAWDVAGNATFVSGATDATVDNVRPVPLTPSLTVAEDVVAGHVVGHLAVPAAVHYALVDDAG